ncbi:MAG: LysR family transcriptional regulator [Quisquiliibacterium sp.]
MNLRTLANFVAIADAGSLTAAAAAIPIAQPALTRQLRELETELGTQLFQRLPRGVRLTAAGIVLYEAARQASLAWDQTVTLPQLHSSVLYETAQRVLADIARTRQRLSQDRGGSRSTIVLGASPTLARVLLPGLFERWIDAQDSIELRSREAFTPQLLDWLERGQVDMAIVTNPERGRRLSLHPLLGEPFALVSHARMGMARIVSVEELDSIPLLMTSLHRGIVDRQLMPLARQLRLKAEIDSVDSIRELVLRGRHATIMPVSVFKDAGRDTGIQMSEISGVQLNRMLVLASRIERVQDPALATAREQVENEFSRLVARGVFSLTRTERDASAG